MVYSGLYPIDGSDYPMLRDALDKLQLNDASLLYEPETSTALGFGFRCGFLGLLHLEIVRERLEREFDLALISTAPNVVYRVDLETGGEVIVTNPADWPAGKIDEIFEPVVDAMILLPSDYVGAVMDLCQTRRGALKGMEYLSEDRVEIKYTLPLAEIIFDFFDQLKSRTRGYASLDYEPAGEQALGPGQGRHPAAGRAGRRVQRDRAQGQGIRLRHDDGLEAARADPAPAVRGADPGRDRLPGDRAREHPRDAQGRARQVLRR